MSAPRLEPDDVRWSRGGRDVLRGPSGAGSTLLRPCNRLEVPDSGAVRCDGADVSGWPATELGAAWAWRSSNPCRSGGRSATTCTWPTPARTSSA